MGRHARADACGRVLRGFPGEVKGFGCYVFQSQVLGLKFRVDKVIMVSRVNRVMDLGFRV